MSRDPWIQENNWALDSVCFLHSIIPYTSIRSSHGNEKKNKVKAGTDLRDSSMLKSPSDLPEDPIKVL